MVKLNSMLLLLLSIAFIECRTAQIKQETAYRLNDCLDMSVELSQDTVLLDDEIFLTIIFQNKTDTSVYFYPNALIYIDRYLPPQIYTAGNMTGYNISFYENMHLVLLKPHDRYSKTYQIKMSEPLLQLGVNKLFVGYGCNASKKQKQVSKALYGGMKSPVFEIFVKEKITKDL